MIVHNAHQQPMRYVGIDCFKCERGISIQLKCKMSKFILTASGLHLGRFTIISRVVCIRAAGHVAIFFHNKQFCQSGRSRSRLLLSTFTGVNYSMKLTHSSKGHSSYIALTFKI